MTTEHPNAVIEHWDIVYTHDMGPVVTEFYAKLAEDRIVGRHCPKCDRVLMPPRSFCDRDFVCANGLACDEAKCRAPRLDLKEGAACRQAFDFCAPDLSCTGATADVSRCLRGPNLGEACTADFGCGGILLNDFLQLLGGLIGVRQVNFGP